MHPAPTAKMSREVYNPAAQSFVGVSFDQPVLTGQIIGLGARNVLDAIHILVPGSCFCQATTLDVFGNVQERPRTSLRHSCPQHLWCCVLCVYCMMVNYRISHGAFPSNTSLLLDGWSLRRANYQCSGVPCARGTGPPVTR